MCGEALKTRLIFREASQMYTLKSLRKALLSMIRSLGRHPERFARRPGRDFTRRRALTFEKLLFLLLTMSEKSIGKNLMKHFRHKADAPSSAAFVQQRQKLLPAALEELYHRFTTFLQPPKRYRGFRLLAVDGSSLKSAACPSDPLSYRPGTERQHGWNLHHINALLDLENGIYTDVLVQKEYEKNEPKALCELVDRSSIAGPVLLLADRNYESYNDLAHLEKGGWKYVIRLRDRARVSVAGIKLPEQPEFDFAVRLTLGRLTRRQLDQRGCSPPEPYYRVPNGVTFDFLEPDSDRFYTISFRVVRLQVRDGRMVTLLTNLALEQFPPDVLKVLYARRWGIETSFRDLKYALGLVYLHAKKPDLVLQEIYAAFLLFNLTQAAAWGVDTGHGSSKYKRHVNFSDAVELCCAFLRRPAGDFCALLTRNLVPYRPNRSYPRPQIADNRIAFPYRTAR